MSAAGVAPNAAPTDPKSPEAEARKGYDELVAMLDRRAHSWDGIQMGTRKTGILIGMSLSNAAPVFMDPFQLDPPVLGIMGDAGTGRHFAADLLALRAKWTWPARVVDVHTTDAPARYPEKAPHPIEPRRRGTSPPRCVIAPFAPGESVGFRPSRVTPCEWPFRGLMFRMATPPEGSFKPTEREWLPKARLAREAGYAEGLLFLPWMTLPLAVVASTPEYEFLTAKHGAPTVVSTPVG